MADDNKPLKYIRYAIGEIVLVVIGILIALSINTWNLDRIGQNEKKEMLSELHLEFKAHKEVLINYRIIQLEAMNSGIALIKLIGASNEELLKNNLDSLFFETFPSNELAFGDNAVKNIVQNGRLNLFKDEAITNLLYQWNSLADIRKTRFDKLDSWNNEHFLPFLLPYMSFKEMDSQANYRWAGKSKVKPNYYPLFQKVEFENLLDNALWLHQQIIDRLKETENLIDNIIDATKP